MSYEELWKTASATEADFVVFARAFIAHKTESTKLVYEEALALFKKGVSVSWLDSDYEPAGTLRWLLELSRHYGLFLNLDLKTFKEKIEGRRRFSRSPRFRSSYWYELHGVDFRKGLGFTFTGQEKKEESAKEIWRTANGHYRDKAKRQGGKFGGTSMKKIAKAEYNSKLRALEKRLMESETYDKLPKKFPKPWMD